MLMALIRPSRSIASLNLDQRRYIPEGVTLPQQSWLSTQDIQKIWWTFFFPAFPSNKRLLPVAAVRMYEEKTKHRRGEPHHSYHFISLIKPYKQVTSSTIAGWIKSILAKLGIDTNIF